MHFDKRFHSEVAGESGQVVQNRHFQGGRDQQHRVGTVRARLVKLISVDNEVLAQEGHHNVLPNGIQDPQIALKKRLVRQYRDGRGTMSSVSGSNGKRIEVGADDTGGRGGLLDFGDDARFAAVPGLQGFPEVSGGRQRFYLVAQCLQRNGLPRTGHFQAFAVQDAR